MKSLAVPCSLAKCSVGMATAPILTRRLWRRQPRATGVPWAEAGRAGCIRGARDGSLSAMFLPPAEAAEVRERFGTPTFVYDRATLEASARAALAFPHAHGLTLRSPLE